MKESRWQTGLIMTALCFMAGVLLFLSEVQSTGEAPQRFGLTITWSIVSMVGAVLILIAIAGAIALYLSERKTHSQ